MPCMALYSRPESSIDVPRLLKKARLSKAMLLKTAAIWMVGPQYETTLSRAENGQAPIDMNAIVNLPLPIVFKFCRLVIAAKLLQWETETLHERKSA